jgi:hypothetical protein
MKYVLPVVDKIEGATLGAEDDVVKQIRTRIGHLSSVVADATRLERYRLPWVETLG